MSAEVVKTFTHTDAATEWANSTERRPVFSVTRNGGDGEPVVETFTMPAKPNPGLALDYLRRARREGGDLANSWLIEVAIGEQGYDALVEELASTEGNEALAVLTDIVTAIQKVAMGGLEGKG